MRKSRIPERRRSCAPVYVWEESGVIRRFDVCQPDELERGLAAATAAARRGELVVLPTESAPTESQRMRSVRSVWRSSGRPRIGDLNCQFR